MTLARQKGEGRRTPTISRSFGNLRRALQYTFLTTKKLKTPKKQKSMTEQQKQQTLKNQFLANKDWFNFTCLTQILEVATKILEILQENQKTKTDAGQPEQL